MILQWTFWKGILLSILGVSRSLYKASWSLLQWELGKNIYKPFSNETFLSIATRVEPKFRRSFLKAIKPISSVTLKTLIKKALCHRKFNEHYWITFCAAKVDVFQPPCSPNYWTISFTACYWLLLNLMDYFLIC